MHGGTFAFLWTRTFALLSFSYSFKGCKKSERQPKLDIIQIHEQGRILPNFSLSQFFLVPYVFSNRMLFLLILYLKRDVGYFKNIKYKAHLMSFWVGYFNWKRDWAKKKKFNIESFLKVISPSIQINKYFLSTYHVIQRVIIMVPVSIGYLQCSTTCCVGFGPVFEENPMSDSIFLEVWVIQSTK